MNLLGTLYEEPLVSAFSPISNANKFCTELPADAMTHLSVLGFIGMFVVLPLVLNSVAKHSDTKAVSIFVSAASPVVGLVGLACALYSIVFVLTSILMLVGRMSAEYPLMEGLIKDCAWKVLWAVVFSVVNIGSWLSARVAQVVLTSADAEKVSK